MLYYKRTKGDNLRETKNGLSEIKHCTGWNW
uniref:Uncharacterized protein n=1 Tax=Siphoviridae sp. ctbxa26 TaxID=2825568 RepID=A0A8S5VEX6_9CAUD|nr:MAG TPA: hypothetical protein [Siphoviridae sp. ctbxa26]